MTKKHKNSFVSCQHEIELGHGHWTIAKGYGSSFTYFQSCYESEQQKNAFKISLLFNFAKIYLFMSQKRFFVLSLDVLQPGAIFLF